jgi:hypothetical protein
VREKIAESMIDELEKIGYLGLATKATKAVAGKALKGAATGYRGAKPTGVKQGLLKRVIQNPTVRSAASSVGTGLAFTLPGMAMQPKQPTSKEPVTGGLR